MPLGLWRMRTAVSTLFTFCPPGPPAREKVTSRSLGLTLTSRASTIGKTATEAVEVCTRPDFFGFRNPLYAMDTRFMLERVVGSFTLHFRGEPFIAIDGRFVCVNNIEVPSALRGITLIHACQIAGEDRRFIAARASPDFHENFIGHDKNHYSEKNILSNACLFFHWTHSSE